MRGVVGRDFCSSELPHSCFMFNVEIAEVMVFFFWLGWFQVSDFSKRRLQSCVMIGCTRRAGAGSTRDRRLSFPKDPHSLANAVDNRRTAGFGTKKKKEKIVVSVRRGHHYVLEKLFTVKSYPDFKPCVVRPQRQTPAKMSRPFQALTFSWIMFDREFRALASLCLNFT